VGSSTGYFDLVGLTSATPDTRLNNPLGVAIDSNGAIYVADYSNYVVRKLSGGLLSTIAGTGSSTLTVGGGTAITTPMRPSSVAVDSSGNLFIASDNSHVIYELTTGGAFSTVAGVWNTCTFADGALGTGKLCNPRQVAVGPDGSVYIADFSNSRVRKVTAG